MSLRRTAAICLLLGAASSSDGAPQRVVSLNLCADELVLRLASPGTVQSVTWLARDPTLSNVAELARQVPVNRGLAEDIVPLAPDLVIAGAYTARTAVALLRRLQIPILELDVPGTVEEALRQIETVAAALGARGQGEQLIDDIRKRFDRLTIVARGPEQPIAAVYQPNGFTIGKGSLVDDLMSRAGLRNLAAERRVDNYGVLSLEVLLFAQPDLLIMNTADDAGPALAYEVLNHPALVHRYPRHRIITIPSAWWSCPGPRMVDAVERMHEAAQRVGSNARDRR